MKTLDLGGVMLACPLAAKIEYGKNAALVDGNGMEVGFVCAEFTSSYDDDVAIAHLFAASPDLLLAAEEAVALCRDGEDLGSIPDDVIELLSAAIARARGQTP